MRLAGIAVLPIVVHSAVLALDREPLKKFRLQAIVLADDDGSRTAAAAGFQIQRWVDYANEAWRLARFRFEFDPRRIVTLRHTRLNRMMGEEDGDWPEVRGIGDRIAARFPGRIVVFFRHGPGEEPTGRGFSWTDYNFIVMPGFEHSRVCGRQNIALLAHELGHYFGLVHTFDREFRTVQEAMRHYEAAGHGPRTGAGNRLSDTPSTPHIQELQCTADQFVELGGELYLIPRWNLMSYYYHADPKRDLRQLSPQQSAWARRVAHLRQKGGGPLPSNRTAGQAIAFESLEIERQSGVWTEVQTMSHRGPENWTRGRHLFCRAAPKGSLTLLIPVKEGGRYRMAVYGTLAPDYGRIRFSVDGRVVGELDGWAPLITPSGRVGLKTVRLQAGTHRFRIDVLGKNAESNGYHFGLDCLEVSKL
jgi:Pregnancy-associated plasma protein-A.